MTDKFSTNVLIHATREQVWNILTTPEIMADWMGGDELQIKVITTWEINSPILIQGFHHMKFENSGWVLQYEKESRLSYSHLSNISRLPDKPENYTVMEFVLTPAEEGTLLTLNIENFPTEVILKHLAFYWRTTIFKIKKVAEEKLTQVS
ncbi:SRPBCC family protein [Chitinophaga niabensis]|uniref:Uncharacterized conserved protein YndB, AHSA1/START domain n=1 Tax=Chitinophaga niabensis TaxID=536979 RepID=A0A1N6H1Y5_9BACT|nr:SRPBCC domain-containing protein [Chitinophaga niabensis]SIO13838.1 Uncharacterized conserved protein YndB, AHSA1/START domain [Chitinophaga niabensis]